MAVSRKGTPTSQIVASGFSNVLTLPSGLAAGDCMILRVGFGAGGSIPVLSTPSGWTALDSQNDGSGSSAFTQATFYRVFVAGDTTVTASFDRTCFSDVDVSAYTGNDTVTPIGASEHSSNASVSAGTTATGTGVTASTNGSYLVYLESDGTGRTSGPAGMSNRLTYDTDLYVDDVAINAGATGNKTSNLGTSQTWIVQMVVIKPAAGGGGGSTGTTLGTQCRAPGYPPRAPLPGIARIGLGVLVGVSGSQAADDGTGSAALSPFAVSGSGAVTFTATGSAAASQFASAAAGVYAISAPVAIPQPQAFSAPSRSPVRIPAPPPLLLGSGLLAPSVLAVPSFSGTASAAASPFAITASGLVTFTGTGSAAASPFAASAAALETFAGLSSAAMSSFASSSAGAEGFAASTSAAMASFAASATGAETFASTASAATSPFASSATGTEQFDGSGSAATSPFASLALGLGAGAISYQPMPQPMSIGFPTRIRLPPIPLLNTRLLIPSVQPVPGVTSTGSAAASPFAVTGSGLVTFIGVGTAAASSFAVSSSGVETFIGTGSASPSSFAPGGAGAEAFTSTASAACSPFTLAATGTTGNAFNGAAACAMSSFAAGANGNETFTGTSSAACSPFAAAASGAEKFTATAAAACQPFAAAGSGSQGQSFSGTAAAVMTSFAATGAAQESFVSSAIAALRSFGVVSIATETFAGSTAIALRPFAALGAGIFSGPIFITGSAALSPFGSSGTLSGGFTRGPIRLVVVSEEGQVIRFVSVIDEIS